MTARWRAALSGNQTSSPSQKPINGARAWRMPVLRAAARPRLACVTTVSRGSAMASRWRRVSSVDPSSTATISRAEAV